MILSSIKIMIIFNNTSADFVFISADVLLKMTIILVELRIAQLCSRNEWTLVIRVILLIFYIESFLAYKQKQFEDGYN